MWSRYEYFKDLLWQLLEVTVWPICEKFDICNDSALGCIQIASVPNSNLLDKLVYFFFLSVGRICMRIFIGWGINDLHKLDICPVFIKSVYWICFVTPHSDFVNIKGLVPMFYMNSTFVWFSKNMFPDLLRRSVYSICFVTSHC